jgi:hypothetical protein
MGACSDAANISRTACRVVLMANACASQFCDGVTVL